VPLKNSGGDGTKGTNSSHYLLCKRCGIGVFGETNEGYANDRRKPRITFRGSDMAKKDLVKILQVSHSAIFTKSLGSTLPPSTMAVRRQHGQKT